MNDGQHHRHGGHAYPDRRPVTPNPGRRHGTPTPEPHAERLLRHRRPRPTPGLTLTPTQGPTPNSHGGTPTPIPTANPEFRRPTFPRPTQGPDANSQPDDRRRRRRRLFTFASLCLFPRLSSPRPISPSASRKPTVPILDGPPTYMWTYGGGPTQARRFAGPAVRPPSVTFFKQSPRNWRAR